MSSATVNLFASFALAGLGAAGLAYTLSHPSLIAEFFEGGRRPSAIASGAENATKIDDQDADAAARVQPGTITLPAGHNGHFFTAAEINGRDIDVMVDTGATLVALTYDDAARAGIFVKPSDFTQTAQTANGITRVAPVTISQVRIGDILVRNVSAVVSHRGASERTLLGMSFLGRLSRVEMRGTTLVLEE